MTGDTDNRACDGRKRCTKCGETKPVTAFYRHARYLDGLTSWCRACMITANNVRQRIGRAAKGAAGLCRVEGCQWRAIRGGECAHHAEIHAQRGRPAPGFCAKPGCGRRTKQWFCREHADARNRRDRERRHTRDADPPPDQET